MKKTFKKRAFISAIAMLVVSAIVLTSATFAWFSMAKQVSVESMDLSITSPDGIQISANTSAWHTSVTADELKAVSTQTRYNAYTGNTNHFPDLLSPSSSAFDLLSSLPAFFSGSISDAGTANISATTDTAGAYVVFDLFVKVGQAQKVNWNNTKLTCADNADVLKAMRIAVVNCGTCTANQTTGLPTPANAASQRAVVFEPSATAGQSTLYVYNGGNNIAATNSIVSNGSYVKALATATQAKSTDTTNQQYFNAAVGINRIRVYLWMEGNDADCTNDVASNTVSFNLVLSIA